MDEREEDDRGYDPAIDEEASFYYMIMDLDYWIKKKGCGAILKELSPEARSMLHDCYAC